VHHLRREYAGRGPRRTRRPPVVALDGVSLQVGSGELFGLLGPNGAGKTTLIKVLVTLLLPTSGSARVGGLDVVTEARRIRERIAVVSGGESSGYGLLTLAEQLWMFAQLHGIPSREARRRIAGLLERVGLAHAADRKVSALSTGMRQKMYLVRGLLSDPDVLFLDEPTVGLDVGAARDIRSLIREWVTEREGRTILLTTHYLAEAEQLCDRIAIIRQGRIVATDTPAAITSSVGGGSRFVVTTPALGPADDGAAEEAARAWLLGLPGVVGAALTTLDGTTETVLDLVDDAAVTGVLQALAARDRPMLSLRRTETTLEEAFVRIVAEPGDGTGGAPGEEPERPPDVP
ncbi:MAG: ABC transporter ATP-binding protein, partial [Actinomycetota bacterium]